MMKMTTMIKGGIDKLANSKMYCKAVSLFGMAVVSMASLSVTASAADATSTTVDPMTTGFENVITLFQKIWEICCSNALLATLLAACLVPVGTRAFRSVKKALK